MARKKQKVPQVDPSPVPPTDAEWDRMIPFKKFIITEPASDEENVEHLFEVGDCVSVLPPNLPNGYGVEDGPAPPLSLMWLGIIKDIRTGQTDQPIEELDAWARVQWFYNKKDLSSVLPKFPTAHLSANERILSDWYDYVHHTCIDDVVPIKRFIFDPTYINSTETSTSSSPDPSEAMLDLTFLQDRIRAASGAKNEAEDEYPVTFYRYDLEVTKKQLSPNASQFNCFSAKASKSYYESLIPSRPDSASKSPSKSNRKPATNTSIPRTNHNSCFSESLYFPPDSDRAQKIGREVARLVREAGDYLESQVSLISETLAGRGEGVPASPVNPSTPGPSSNTRSSSQSASKPSVRITRNTTPSMSSNAQITPRTRSRAIRVESPVASASALLRPSSTSPIKRTRNGLAKSSTNNMESLIVTASQQLFEKLKLAVYQEDTLSMHICPRAECTAPRGRAWHRSCLIREEPNIPSDAEADEEDFDGFKALQNLGSWLSQGYRRNRANETEPPPTYQQIRARWDRMSESQKMQVARMLELLSTIPPGYSRDPDVSDGQYEFPVLTPLDPPSAAKEPPPSMSPKKKGKRKARTSEQEELEVLRDLMIADTPAGQRRKGKEKLRSQSRSRARKDADVDIDDESPRKRRRSLRLSGQAVDSMDVDGEEIAEPQPSSRPLNGTNSAADDADDNDEDLLKIMHCLAQLRAPEFICLASQPMIRGGIPPVPPPASPSDSVFSIAGTTPIFHSNSPFGKAVQTTITGNISRVARARIRLYEVLDRRLERLQKPQTEDMDEDNSDADAGDILVTPYEWADYVVELEGREWLFECFYGSPQNTTASASTPSSTRNGTRSGRWNAENKEGGLSGDKTSISSSSSSSKVMIRRKILGRTYEMLRAWQFHRRNSLLCPCCHSKI